MFQTWGRRDGRGGLTFQEMTRISYERYHLTAGVVGTTSGLGVNMRVAPIGQAFESVYNNSDIPFADLYRQDGSHLSRAGIYLASTCVAGTIMESNTQKLIEADSRPTSQDVTVDLGLTLRSVAARVLEAEGILTASDSVQAHSPMPTAAPVANPTPAPSPRPTRTLTVSPTAAPTRAPTTENPTATPIELPPPQFIVKKRVPADADKDESK